MYCSSCGKNQSNDARFCSGCGYALRGDDELMDAHEVAQMLHVHVSWVRNHSVNIKPILPSIKMGPGRTAKRRFRRSDVLRFVQVCHTTNGRYI